MRVVNQAGPSGGPSRGGSARPSVRSVCAALACACLAACAARAPQIAPPAPPPVGGAQVRVTLLWAEPVDLDLYVTDPDAVTLYFANNPTPSGGRLLADVRCGNLSDSSAGLSEVATFVDPSPGGYRVGVDFIDTCGRKGEPVAYRVVADAMGERYEAAGTVVPERFQLIALEFRVPSVGTKEVDSP